MPRRVQRSVQWLGVIAMLVYIVEYGFSMLFIFIAYHAGSRREMSALWTRGNGNFKSISLFLVHKILDMDTRWLPIYILPVVLRSLNKVDKF